MKALCIKCNDEDAVVMLDLDGTQQFRCQSCEEEFTCEDVRERLAAMDKWRKLLAWVEAYPTEETQESK